MRDTGTWMSLASRYAEIPIGSMNSSQRISDMVGVGIVFFIKLTFSLMVIFDLYIIEAVAAIYPEVDSVLLVDANSVFILSLAGKLL